MLKRISRVTVHVTADCDEGCQMEAWLARHAGAA
jgi:hypothetical protein